MEGLFDIHCHFLWDVDDGARSLEESMGLLLLEYSAGVRNIILTPHYRVHMFETSEHIIRERYEILRQTAAKDFPDLRLYLGCEFHANMEMENQLLSRDQLFLPEKSSHILLEFSSREGKNFCRERVQKALSLGYIPVIAHCERYLFGDPSFFAELKRMGAELQVNADSIIGKDGFSVRQLCKKMIKMDLVDYIGSDGHDLSERRPHIGECYRFLRKKYGEDYAQRIFIENPSRLVR